MIDTDHHKISITRQCEQLFLPSSSYYRGQSRIKKSAENLTLMRLIDGEYTRRPFYGSRKIHDYLEDPGYPINRKCVQQLMRKMGLVSADPKPNTSERCLQHEVYLYLLRGLDINRPNQVWCSDITFICLNAGFVYLAEVTDWYSRRVLPW
ncbi:IS3 family transposase [Zooshikella ganghwensis]|uniref:IS3 family transposase n=1 Tax=Zooshikella ganghwensis TaxID=202772 RepID=UPI000A078BEE|nr:IS3 family transposase [Zooshikella ganghwensis]